VTSKPKPVQTTLFEPPLSIVPAPTTVDGVVVREVRCKTVLNNSSRGDYSFNCYTGCAHGCVYCYARFMQRFHPHEEAWGQFVDVKVNAADVLRRQIKRSPPGSVFSCSACDGWQPMERQYGLTRQCCKMLVDAGFELLVLTKSELVLRDIDILAKGKESVRERIERLGCQSVVVLVEQELHGVDRVEVAKVLGAVHFVARRRNIGGRHHLDVLHRYVGSFVQTGIGTRIIKGKEVVVGEIDFE